MKYKYELDKERLDWITSKVNRSKNQEQFLFDLLDGDFERLKKLEMQLCNCLISYCPGDLEEVENVMKMIPKINGLVL